ncbi:MAG: hypothetical protein KDC02_25645 [Flavobacteriales bacterium]|nr:hypothetical protein [Flavobacteriales bacterium]
MRTLLALLLFTLAHVAIAQQLNPKSFTMVKKKGGVPTQVFTTIGLEDLNELANPGKHYTRGCIRKDGVPNKRLNWAAHNAQGSWWLSVSYGGRANYTVFYRVSLKDGSGTKEAFNGRTLGENGTFNEVIERWNAGTLETSSVF